MPTNTNETPQQEWKRKTLAYALDVNNYVDKGLRDGWDNVGKEPNVPQSEHLAENALEAVRTANASSNTDNLREQWPLDYNPLLDLIKRNGQSIPILFILPDNSILARIGATYEAGYTVHIDGDQVTEYPEISHFGRSPDRRYFAIAQENGVQIIEGWGGGHVSFCPWPTGAENTPAGFTIEPLAEPPLPTALIPFPDGQRVLLICSDGIFVLAPTGAIRLLPTTDDLRKHFQWLQNEYPGDKLKLNLSMEHGAISQDGKLITIGSQDSKHLVFNEQLELIASIGFLSEYPHYVLFSADNSVIACNSCHFYNGITIGVPAFLLPGLETEEYEENPQTPVLEENARVYAGVSRNDEFIVGDAYGYLRAFSITGEYRWQHYIGSTITGMDISEDGKTLVASSSAGFLSIIQLDAGSQLPEQIGNGNHREMRRWLFWKNEPKPLIW